MGLPRVWGRVGGVVVEGGTVGGPVVVRGKDDEDEEEKGKGLGIGWTVAYYTVLIAGAFAWWKSLWWLTVSEGALIDFGP